MKREKIWELIERDGVAKINFDPQPVGFEPTLPEGI